jgi:hypothetical protein
MMIHSQICYNNDETWRLMMQLMIESELAQFELPPAVQKRLQTLLDRQDQGEELTLREEAEGLVELAEFLSLLKLRSKQLPN